MLAERPTVRMIPKVTSTASGRMIETTIAARRLPRKDQQQDHDQYDRFDQHFLDGRHRFLNEVAAVVEHHDPGVRPAIAV